MSNNVAKSYAIIEIDHSAEEANALSATNYISPCKILFLHNSLEKAQVEFLAIIGKYKTTTSTEKNKYQLDFKSPVCVEIKELYEGWIKNSKTRTRTIAVCEYAFGTPEK